VCPIEARAPEDSNKTTAIENNNFLNILNSFSFYVLHIPLRLPNHLSAMTTRQTDTSIKGSLLSPLHRGLSFRLIIHLRCSFLHTSTPSLCARILWPLEARQLKKLLADLHTVKTPSPRRVRHDGSGRFFRRISLLRPGLGSGQKLTR